MSKPAKEEFFENVGEQVVDDALWESIEAAAAHQAVLDPTATAPNTAPPAMPVPGEGDWAVDPESGLVVEIDRALLKLGWTEFPRLPMEPTAEQLDEFEQKLDQVTDKIAGHLEAIARVEAALQAKRDEKCKPKESAINYWSSIAEPMAKALAPYRLPRYKSGQKAGEYSKKTMHLDSAGWQFTAGGGYRIFDYELVKQTILEQGVEKYSEYGAKLTVAMNYQKFAAAVKAGKFPELAGTEHTPPDPLAKAKVVLPKQKGGNGGEESSDPE